MAASDIQKIKDLLDTGFITEEEYDRRIKEILGDNLVPSDLKLGAKNTESRDKLLEDLTRKKNEIRRLMEEEREATKQRWDKENARNEAQQRELAQQLEELKIRLAEVSLTTKCLQEELSHTQEKTFQLRANEANASPEMMEQVRARIAEETTASLMKKLNEIEHTLQQYARTEKKLTAEEEDLSCMLEDLKEEAKGRQQKLKDMLIQKLMDYSEELKKIEEEIAKLGGKQDSDLEKELIPKWAVENAHMEEEDRVRKAADEIKRMELEKMDMIAMQERERQLKMNMEEMRLQKMREEEEQKRFDEERAMRNIREVTAQREEREAKLAQERLAMKRAKEEAAMEETLRADKMRRIEADKKEMKLREEEERERMERENAMKRALEEDMRIRLEKKRDEEEAKKRVEYEAKRRLVLEEEAKARAEEEAKKRADNEAKKIAESFHRTGNTRAAEELARGLDASKQELQELKDEQNDLEETLQKIVMAKRNEQKRIEELEEELEERRDRVLKLTAEERAVCNQLDDAEEVRSQKERQIRIMQEEYELSK